jgi:hypothetical protein
MAEGNAACRKHRNSQDPLARWLLLTLHQTIPIRHHIIEDSPDGYIHHITTKCHHNQHNDNQHNESTIRYAYIHRMS